MRKIFLAIALLPVLAFAQEDKKIQDIKFLYVDEKYDKCISKCESLSDNDSYSRNPLVYIYGSMSYFEVSKNPDKYDEELSKKPFRNSMKWAYKFGRKDKKKEYAQEFAEFLKILKDSASKLGQTFYLTEDFRKSYTIYKDAAKFSNDPVFLMWKGLSELKKNNIAGGEMSVKTALEEINKAGFEPSEETRGTLAFAFKEWADYLSNKGEYSEANAAKKRIEDYKKWDPKVLEEAELAKRKAKAKEQENIIRKNFKSEEFDDDDE